MSKKQSTLFMVTQYESHFDFKNAVKALDGKCWHYAVAKHFKEHDEVHYHFVIQTPTSTTLESVAKVCGVEVQYVEYGKTSVRFMCAYLTHANDDTKEQYTYEESVIIDKINARKYIDNVVEMRSLSIQPILEKIDSGEIMEYNIYDYVSQAQYVKYKRTIETAFEYQNKKHAGEVNRDMDVWFVYGKSGVGKTTFAKEMAKQLGFTAYITSNGKNPFDNYAGQECIILDDCRPSDFKFNDFLKLLDNNTQSLVGCRYYNKSIWRCKLMIITSTLSVEQWYSNLQESDSEAFNQIDRRIGVQFTVQAISKDGVIRAVDSNKNTYLVQCSDWVRKASPLAEKLARFIVPNKKPTLNEVANLDDPFCDDSAVQEDMFDF